MSWPLNTVDTNITKNSNTTNSYNLSRLVGNFFHRTIFPFLLRVRTYFVIRIYLINLYTEREYFDEYFDFPQRRSISSKYRARSLRPNVTSADLKVHSHRQMLREFKQGNSATVTAEQIRKRIRRGTHNRSSSAELVCKVSLWTHDQQRCTKCR